MRTCWLNEKTGTFGESLVAHGAGVFFEEFVRRGFPVAFDVAESFGVSELSVSLESYFEVSSEISNLAIRR